MKKMKEYLIEKYLGEAVSFEVGKWIVQRRTDDNEWALIVGQLKNKSWKVVSKSDERVGGNAASKTTSGWYPAPELVDEKEVPSKIKEKILKKAKQLGVI
jgi:hypothetical protein